jgi:hypothetical protein
VWQLGDDVDANLGGALELLDGVVQRVVHRSANQSGAYHRV